MNMIGCLLAASIVCVPFVSCFTSIGNDVYNHNNGNALSSHSDRREFIQTTFTKFGIAVIVPSILPSIANADAGSSANMKLPNYIDFLIEKNAQGLVDDPDKLLYKGPDVEVLCTRKRRFVTNRLVVAQNNHNFHYILWYYTSFVS